MNTDTHDRPMTTLTPEGLAQMREYIAGLRPGEAALSKGAALRLLDALDAETSRADRAEAAVKRVRALHAPREEEALTGYCSIEECDHEDECPTTPFTVCTECWRVAEETYRFFGEDGIAPVLCPCPTVRALDGARPLR